MQVQIQDLILDQSLCTDLVCVEQLADGDVDDRFVDDEQLRVFVHVESVVRFGNVTNTQQELPVGHKHKSSVQNRMESSKNQKFETEWEEKELLSAVGWKLLQESVCVL